MLKIINFILLLVSYQSMATQELAGKNFLFKYEGNQHYQVTFTETEVTWRGIKGNDTGKSETDKYQASLIAPSIHFVQWNELDGTFVALTINLKTKKIISTGISGTYQWFRRGSFLYRFQKQLVRPI